MYVLLRSVNPALNTSPICPEGGSAAREIATFVWNQVLKVNMSLYTRDERPGCSQGVRHQKKGMCVCMDLISLISLARSVGNECGFDSWKSNKGNFHVCLPFLCVLTSLLQSRAVEHHTGGKGLGWWGLCLLQQGTWRATLQCSHVCSSGVGTFTHTFQLETSRHTHLCLSGEAHGESEGAMLHR